MDPLGGRGPLAWELFGKNVCKNERIGSHGGVYPARPPRSANDEYIFIGPCLYILSFNDASEFTRYQ